MTTPQHAQPHYQPPMPAPAPREHPAMTALRVVTYISTTIASIVFVLVVLHVNNKVQEFQNTMDSLFPGTTPSSSPWNRSGGLFGN